MPTPPPGLARALPLVDIMVDIFDFFMIGCCLLFVVDFDLWWPKKGYAKCECARCAKKMHRVD